MSNSKKGTIQFFCMSLVIFIVFISIIVYKRNLDDYLDKLDELNLRCKCETRTVQRVVNGKLEDNLFFPWQVSISKLGGHVCMGTIVNQYYILTSQHCFSGSKNAYEVRVGLFELFDDKISEKTYRIDEIYNYPQFKLENVLDGGDISLVKLKSPIKFEHGLVEPACLELENPGFESSNSEELLEKAKKKDLLITSGFGTTLPVVIHNNKLLHKVVPSLVLKTGYFNEVTDLFLNDPNSKELLKKFICISSLDKNNDNNCHGHSGASLNGKNANGLVVVKGVSSLSIPIKINETTVQFCKSFSLYSRLIFDKYKEFIENVVGNLKCKISLIEQNKSKPH